MSATSERNELAEARARHGLTPSGDPAEDDFGSEGAQAPAARGRSARERAQDEPAEPASEQGEQEELFVIEQGRKVTLSQLIGRNTPIEYRMQMSGLTQRGVSDMGLIPFNDPDVVLIVPARAGKVVSDPTYNEDGTVKKVTITALVKSKSFHDSRSEVAQSILGQ